MNFNDSYIESLFTLQYPKCCSDWDGPDSDDEINEYGQLLKHFASISNNLDQQVEHVKKIVDILEEKYNDEEIKIFIINYNNIKKGRKERIRNSAQPGCCCSDELDPVPNLSHDNDEVWGSKRQYLYGYVCCDIFKNNNLHLPAFMCSALNPTGGICGPGNTSLYRGTVNSHMIVHSCMHDASGYCYNYHKIGQGYNYLDTFWALSTSSPMSCQIMGISTCLKIKNRIEKK